MIDLLLDTRHPTANNQTKPELIKKLSLHKLSFIYKTDTQQLESGCQLSQKEFNFLDCLVTALSQGIVHVVDDLTNEGIQLLRILKCSSSILPLTLALTLGQEK